MNLQIDGDFNISPTAGQTCRRRNYFITTYIFVIDN